MLISPARIAPNAIACHATCPPTVFSARAGPVIARNATFCSMLSAARSNSAWVEYSPSADGACE
jgi:hypothetical protein